MCAYPYFFINYTDNLRSAPNRMYKYTLTLFKNGIRAKRHLYQKQTMFKGIKLWYMNQQ